MEVLGIYEILEYDGDWYLRLVDVVQSKKDDCGAVTISIGGFKEQKIGELDGNYKEKKLVYRSIPCSDEAIFEGLRESLLNGYRYKEIVEGEENTYLVEIFDKEKIKELDNISSFVEKRADLTENIIKQIENNGRFTLNPEQFKLLMSGGDSLKVDGKEDKEKINIKDVYNEMKKIVFGQDEQMKKLLANILFNYDIFKNIDDKDEAADVKKTILLIGATGTGKTLMIKTLAKLLNIPYTIEDASRYTANGYKGEDVDSMLVNMVETFGDEAKRGIIFIDEVDKICGTKRNENGEVGTTSVQEHLLKVIEGTVIRTRVRRGVSEVVEEIDTRGMTFVLSGAFEDLTKEGNFKEEDLEKFGLIRNCGLIHELAARITPIIMLEKPTKENLKDALLHSKRSYLKQMEEYFNIMGIDFTFSDDYIDYVVDTAYELDDGYRGLKQVIDRE